MKEVIKIKRSDIFLEEKKILKDLFGDTLYNEKTKPKTKQTKK